MPDDPQAQPTAGPVEERPLPERPVPKRIPFRARLPQPSHEYRSALGKWLARGEAVDDQAGHELKTHP